MMKYSLIGFIFTLFSLSAFAAKTHDEQAIRQATLDYIESQINVKPEQMRRALHQALKKRTYWKDKMGKPFVMETSADVMERVAATYNKAGDKFSSNPTIDIQIFDIDQRVASVKLTVDDWIDYLHLMKDDTGQWKIINVLWQYHDTTKHQNKK